jgi:hypothetical protein
LQDEAAERVGFCCDVFFPSFRAQRSEGAGIHNRPEVDSGHRRKRRPEMTPTGMKR